MHDVLKSYENSLSPYIVHFKQLREADIKDMSLHIENAKLIHKKEVCCPFYKSIHMI